MSNEEERGFKVKDHRGQEKEEKAEPLKSQAVSQETKQDTKEKEESSPQGNQHVDFSALIFSLTTSAMISMGVMENPQTKKKSQDLGMAKQQVDILEMLQTKTKGNLTEAEEKFLTDALYQLRMVYVDVSK